MTLLSICQDAATEIGINAPTAVIGSTFPEVEKLLRYSNKVGLRIMKVAAWQALRKEQTFTALATETQTAILPSDFDRFVPETFWDRTNHALMIGPITAVEWQGLKAESYSNTSARKFIHRNNAISVIPVPAGGETYAFEYVSKNWCQSSGAVAQNRWAADTDTGIVDEELLTLGLIYEFLDGEGQPSDKAAEDYSDYFETLLQSDQGSSAILTAGDIFGGSRHFSGTPAVNVFGLY